MLKEYIGIIAFNNVIEYNTKEYRFKSSIFIFFLEKSLIYDIIYIYRY